MVHANPTHTTSSHFCTLQNRFIRKNEVLSVEGRCRGTVSKAMPFDMGIPYGCWFMSWLPCFQPSIQLMRPGKQQRIVQMPGPGSPMWQTRKKLLSLAWLSPSHWNVQEVNQRMERHLSHVSPSLCGILNFK